MLRLVLFLTLSSAAVGAETPQPPAIRPLIWLWPHEITWRLDDGPMWASVGHTATVLTLVPLGVKEQDGRIVRTRDGSGRIYAVELAARAVAALDPRTGAPARAAAVIEVQPHRVGEPPPKARPLAPLQIRADDPNGPKPKRGLHRKRNGNWDFHLYNPLPKAPYTFHDRMFFVRSADFQYCLIVHAEGDTTPMPERFRRAVGSDQAFKTLRVYVLVSELLKDPTVKMTLSWPDGQPMPPGLRPSTAWYARLRVKPRWAPTGPPIRAELGPVRVGPQAGLVFLPATTTSIERARLERERRAARSAPPPPATGFDTGEDPERPGAP